VTFGWGVEESEAWPARLEAHLGERGVDAEVLNAGVPGSRVEGMLGWCEEMAAALEPDLVIWARRPGWNDPRPYNRYVDAVRRCGVAAEAPVLVVLPPVSTFDLHGGRVWRQEQEGLTARLGPTGVEVVELTSVFRSAQQGRGEVLRRGEGWLRVYDQERDVVRLQVTDRGDVLPRTIHQLFEAEPQVREALFFDDGHPDEAGYDLMARVVAARLRLR